VSLKILFINPVGTPDYDPMMKEIIDKVKRDDVEAVIWHLEKGPTHLEYHYYEHLVLGEILRLIKKAENEGFNAVVIGCFYDPGLREAREIVSIPVVGPAEASLHLASMLGHKFSILVGRRKWIPKMEDNVRLYGLKDKLASFRVLNLTVDEMGKDREKTKEAIKREAKKAVEEDGAEVVVLGCTVESGFIDELIKELRVPIIDAVVAAWKTAEMLADLHTKVGLGHSKIYGYEAPPAKEGWISCLISRNEKCP